MALVLGALPLCAQSNPAKIQQDIEYARGLAASWGFTDMSEQVLARLEKTATTGKVAEEVQLLKCDIYAISAGRVADRVKRDQLLKQALTAYENYIGSHSGSESLPRAELAYLETALNYGRSLSAAAEEAAGAEVAAIKNELQETLTRAVAKTGDLVNGYMSKSERSESENRQLYELMMNRGTMLLLIAGSQEDGTFNYEQAKKSYEQVIDLSGETGSPGLRAFIGVGDVFLAQGKSGEAADCYQFVGDIAIPRDEQQWAEEAKELPQDEKQRRFALLQLATPGLIRARMAEGDAPAACAEGMRFLNVWNREGLDLVPPYGYQSLLGIVGALNDAGGFVGGDLKGGSVEWFSSAEQMQAKFTQKRQQRPALDLALTLAQQINEDNRGNALSARAQRLIADIIEQPGVEVSPTILLEAARGKVGERDFIGGIAAYKRVLSAIESQDAAVRTEFGPKVLNAIGRSYQALDRNLEAAQVFQEAVTTWLGDPEFDGLNSKSFYDSVNSVRRKIKGDPLIEALFAEAERAVEQNSKDTSGEIVFRRASKLYEDKNWAGAREEFKKVPATTESYEKALVFVGVCEYQIGRDKDDFAAAIRAFDDYLNKYLKDPLHALGAAETRKEAKRNEAIATATFYWGLSEYYLADAGKGDWNKVVALLNNYEDRFLTQDRLAPAAMFYVILAQYGLGNQAAVDATYAKLLERFPSSAFASRAAIEVYLKLQTAQQKLAESKDPADQKKAKDLLRQMAGYLEVGNSKGANPSFANLRNESKHWMDLQEWAKAEALLTKIREKFTGVEANQSDMERYVLPDLGRALAMQQKMVDAAAVLAPLVEAKKATLETTVLYARTLAGYAELTFNDAGKPQNVRTVAGVGGKESLEQSLELFGKLLETVKARDGSFTPPWLDMKFDQLYAMHVASKLDGKFGDALKGQFLTLEGEYGPSLAELPNADQRMKFQWLQQNAK